MFLQVIQLLSTSKNKTKTHTHQTGPKLCHCNVLLSYCTKKKKIQTFQETHHGATEKGSWWHLWVSYVPATRAPEERNQPTTRSRNVQLNVPNPTTWTPKTWRQIHWITIFFEGNWDFLLYFSYFYLQPSVWPKAILYHSYVRNNKQQTHNMTWCHTDPHTVT